MYFSISKTSIFFAVALFLSLPVSVLAANLTISPASGTFEVGERVTVRVVVTSDTPINAVSGIVTFPTTLFSVDSISKSGSILNFWVSEPNFSQGAGTLQFEGVTLSGFNGGVGTVVTVTLRALKVGTGTITFKSGQVLANDGQGTDVTSGMSGATLSVRVAESAATPIGPSSTQEVEAPQPLPSLLSPEIALVSKYGEKAISGRSNYPNSQVLVTFVSQGGVKVFITGVTDSTGEFILLVPHTLKRDTYRVSAVVIKGDLSNSRTSNEIVLPIGNFFSDISWEIRLVILLLIMALIYLIVRSYHYLVKNKNLRTIVRKESQEADKILHKSFKILREDAGSNKQIRNDLDDAEELISKEINDIEKS